MCAGGSDGWASDGCVCGRWGLLNGAYCANTCRCPCLVHVSCAMTVQQGYVTRSSTHVWVCVCPCVRLYTWRYICSCMHVHAHVCAYVCLYTWLYIWFIHVCVYVCAQGHTHVHVHPVYTYLLIVHMSMYMSIHTCPYTHLCTHAYVYVCTHVCATSLVHMSRVLHDCA